MSDIENEGCGSLAPVFDMLNHANEPNCDWESDAGAQITIDAQVKAGDELFISYGQRKGWSTRKQCSANTQLVSELLSVSVDLGRPYLFIQDDDIGRRYMGYNWNFNPKSFNYKLAQYYGFTMDLTSKPYFVLQEEELINACQDRLGRSYEICSDQFSAGYAIDEEVWSRNIRRNLISVICF